MRNSQEQLMPGGQRDITHYLIDGNRCVRGASKGASTHSQGRLTRWGAWASAQALLTARPEGGPGRQSPSRGRGTPHTCARQWSGARRASQRSEGRPCGVTWRSGARGHGSGEEGRYRGRGAPGHAPMLSLAACTVASAAGKQASRTASWLINPASDACMHATEGTTPRARASPAPHL